MCGDEEEVEVAGWEGIPNWGALPPPIPPTSMAVVASTSSLPSSSFSFKKPPHRPKWEKISGGSAYGPRAVLEEGSYTHKPN